MKTLCIALSLCILALNAYSQTYVVQVKPKGKSTWGYMTADGTMIIEPQYSKCYPFSDVGIAAYRENNKYIFIGLSGNRQYIPLKEFSLIDYFSGNIVGFQSGMLAVNVNKYWGFVNEFGEIAIPIKYTWVSEFNQNHAIVESNGNFLVINKKGEEIPVKATSITEAKHFTEGLAPFMSKNENFGFLDTLGNVAVEAKFVTVGYFSGGVAWARNQENKLGFIDQEGNWAIEPQFDWVNHFDPTAGMARVKKGDKWGYINKEGKWLVMMSTQSLGDFNEGLASGKMGLKFGFYNNKGVWVIPPQFDGVREFKNGYAAAKEKGLWGMIDRTGKWVIPAKFNGIRDMELVK